ncbi:putative zn 2cys6 transcription factor protein [Ilyonectria robusta]
MSSPNLNPTVPKSAPYGHACVGCSKAKSRCISRGPGNSCQRCHRMSKECHPSTVASKRLARRPASKTVRLEEKLDDLVTLLKTQAATKLLEQRHDLGGARSDQQHNGFSSGLPTRSIGDSLHRQPNEAIPAIPDIRAEPGRLSEMSSVRTTPHSADSLHSLPLPPSQADEYLRTFQAHHLKALPFIHIPPELTAARLQRERPFLWLNIRALCCKSTLESDKFHKTVRETLAQSLIVDGERSIDLLLGLIAYLAWRMDHGKGKKILCTYSNLAASLVFDLRLDRSDQETPCKEEHAYKSFDYPIKQQVPTYRTNEQRRVTLACFSMCSTISSFLKSQPMRWTSHMEDCLRHLANEAETPGDELLVSIVQIQKVMDVVTTLMHERLFESEAHGPPKAPSILHVKALRLNLEAIEKGFRPEMAESKVVRSYLYDTYMMINNLALCSTGPPTNTFMLNELERTRCFYACIHAIKQGLDNWFCLTPGELFGASLGLLLHFGRYTHVLYRLAMREDPAWDRAAVRNAVDLIQTLERGAEHMGAVPEAVQFRSDASDFFTKCAMTLRGAIPIWQRALGGVDATLGTDLAAQNAVELEAPDVAPGDFVAMDFSDDAWLSEVFSSWES